MSCVEVLEDHGGQVAEESTDFVQSHVDSFFPPTEGEVIEDDYEEELDLESEANSGITLTAFDSAGIDYVVVRNKDNGKSVRLSVDEAEELHKKSEKFVKNVIRYLEEEGFL
ncbi:MAG: hypothetical protein ACOC53_07130 [Candidatus Saliniplasma sp.]